MPAICGLTDSLWGHDHFFSGELAIKCYFAVCSYLVKLFLPISGCRDFIEGTKKRHFCPSLNQGLKGVELGFMIVGVIEILRGKINFCRLWG